MMNIAHYTIVSDIDHCTIVSVHLEGPLYIPIYQSVFYLGEQP